MSLTSWALSWSGVFTGGVKNERDYIDCDACGTPNPQHKCAKCHCTYYCNKKCQVKHWKAGHKKDCVSVEEMQSTMLLGLEPLPHELIDQPSLLTTKCGICHKAPMTHPCILPDCHHGFCFVCLKNHQGYDDWSPFPPQEDPVHPRDRITKCPICRTLVHQSVVMDIIDRAKAYRARADRLEDDPTQRSRLMQMALEEVDMILSVEPNDFWALCEKGEILIHSEPSMVHGIHDMICEVDKQNEYNQYHFALTMAQISELREKRQVAAANLAMRRAEAMMDNKATRPKPFTMGDGPHRFNFLKILKARAYEAQKNWTEALAIYSTITCCVPYNKDDGMHIDQYCAKHCGESRCYYELGEYMKAMDLGGNVIYTKREYPGGHKLVAMAQQKLKETKKMISTTFIFDNKQYEYDAIQMMYRGILYEAPWDDANRRTNQQYLRELLLLNSK